MKESKNKNEETAKPCLRTDKIVEYDSEACFHH